MTTQQILERAKAAKSCFSALSESDKNTAIYAIADSLEEHTEEILLANSADLQAAKGIISEVMLDRLALTKQRIADMAKGVREVACLPDPVGEVLSEHTREDGLNIKKVSVPLGVVAIIYESRPNVTSDAAALCLKSGNVCVLRTGKEAHRSASAIVNAMKDGLKDTKVNPDAINLIEDTSRASANELMTAVGYVDLLIPRGGAGLIKACVENAKVPCIQTGTGICHVYVNRYADTAKALKIIENAKCSRPSVCNAMEVCLVDEAIANRFLPELWQVLVQSRAEKPVELRLDEKAYSILGGKPYCIRAGEDDFDTEFLDYKMAVRVVSGVAEAVEHVSKHSTGHSESIVTENSDNAEYFSRAVDSAAVYVNASTRFTDGGQFGLGCEMGISTQKLHARGPMGLKELTTYKYVVTGDGNVR
ncbi:MAG: glutamate-5-semialdehyde dehydrogenase [Candidatus Coproplasma sp.]